MKTEKSALQIIAEAAKSPEYNPAAVKALMKRLDINEKGFALLMNVAPLTVRLWTTGATRPCGLSRRLIQLYDICPDLIGNILSGKEYAQ